ncbi:hypothetical protein IL306_010866 [Fusarium sp. DS 682]|nr:hypothetical protein IL306_010866 [Fusarium sp. DS 682]
MDIVEFYVSCNPPLLPKGVALIFASVEEKKNGLVSIVKISPQLYQYIIFLTIQGIFEILYEPEIPWFKIICQGTSQREISSWMHSQLEELVENEAGAIIQDEDEVDIGTFDTQPDIEVLEEEPHIIPFPSLRTIPKDILDQYDEFRYPDSIKDLPYKAVWSVPESSGVSITQILSNYESLGSISPSGPSIDSLQALTNCALTHNLQGSLIYIGSDKSEQALLTVKQKLDNLAKFMDAPLAPTAHMIFTETPEGDDKQDLGEAEYTLHRSSDTSREVDESKAPQAVKAEDVSGMNAKVEQQTPTLDGQASLVQRLLDLDSPEELELLSFPNPSHPNINGRQDLMDINDGPITTPALMDETRMPIRLDTPECLSEAQSTYSEVIFGKTDDQKKDLFDTMGQKAAPGQSWASIASKKGTEKQKDNKTLEQNSRDTVVSGNRSTARIPAASIPQENTSTNPQVTRIVPGIDMPTIDQVQYDEIVSQAENKLSKLVEVLQVAPGKVSVQAQFGRLCRKDTFPALVYDGQEPSWFVSKTVEALNTENPHMGFYPLLTTSGAEANLIPKMLSGKASWKLTGTRVFYEFLCVAEKTRPFRVEVDARTFHHQCFPMATELSKAFVHCTRRAWDVKFSVSRMHMEGIADDMEVFAASLVRSMSIKTNDMKEIVIDVEPKGASKWCIDRVLIRHEAMYRDGAKGPSCLKITMTRRVEKLPGIPKGRYQGQSVPVAPPGNGQPSQWFEASISSVRGEEMLQENMGLKFGDKTHWTPETLQNQGVFKAICEPTMKMVSQMDQVGDSNSNGHGPRTDRQSYSAVQDSMARQQGVYFW